MNQFFSVTRETRVKVDALHPGITAPFEQNYNSAWKTLAFASRFLKGAEIKYSTNELEPIGLVWSLNHFKNYLLGSQIKKLTDHKALIGALKDDHYAKTTRSRLIRWADHLLPYAFSVEHMPSKVM